MHAKTDERTSFRCNVRTHARLSFSRRRPLQNLSAGAVFSAFASRDSRRDSGALSTQGSVRMEIASVEGEMHVCQQIIRVADFGLLYCADSTAAGNGGTTLDASPLSAVTALLAESERTTWMFSTARVSTSSTT